MPTPGDPPVPGGPRVLVTHDADRATTALGRLLKVERLRVGQSSDGFAFRMVVGSTGTLTLLTAHLGAGGWAETSPADVVPAGDRTDALVTSTLLAGAATFTGPGRHPQRIGTGEVWRLESAEGLHVAYTAGATFADLVLPLPVVAAAAAGRTGARAAADVAEDADGRPLVRFAGHRPLDGGAERYWDVLTRAAAQQVLRPGAPVGPLLREHLVTTLGAAAVLVFPTVPVDHPRGPGFTGPATVRRALDHLHAHAGDPLTVTDLAGAAGIGVRALQQAFLQHLGTTPTAHLQQVRLGRAHADLVAADPGAGDTVGAVARRWGFSHLGRFADAYRARFGVLPSVTLRG